MSVISHIDTYIASVAGPFGPVAQELLVLSVFLISYAIWRHLGQHTKRMRAAKKLSSLEATSTTRRIPSTPNSAQRTGAQLRNAARSPSSASVKAAESQMLDHLENREFTRALNLYRSLERDGCERYFGEELYSAFIQSAVRVGKIDVLERLVRTMKRHGLNPSLQFWQTTLKMLSSRKHFSSCLSIYSIYGRSIPSDKVVFSCCINAALELGVPAEAASMLDRYSEASIDAKDHVLFFRTYVALDDVDSAEAVFRKLGAEITTLMLNLLLLTCVNSNQPERALKFLNEAHGLEKTSAEAKVIVDVVSYNTVIKGLSQTGKPGDCFKCLHSMFDAGIDPDDITFGTLLDACIVDNNMNAAGEIVSLMLNSERAMDTVMCTLFIKGLVRANCLSKALELCEEMKQRKGARPDIITYSVLIKALVDQHDLEHALSLVEDMASAGHKPDDIILTHLLEGCRYAGNHALGKKLFNDMLANGVKPSEFTLVTMLKLHGRCGAHREAHDLVQGWEAQHGSRPSVIHYTCLMSGCLRTKSYDQAWAAYELMCQSGVNPDGTAMSTLLPGMIAAQQWDRVLHIASTALEMPLKYVVPHETLNNALSQMQTAPGFAKQADTLRRLMQRAGIASTYRSRGTHCPRK